MNFFRIFFIFFTCFFCSCVTDLAVPESSFDWLTYQAIAPRLNIKSFFPIDPKSISLYSKACDPSIDSFSINTDSSIYFLTSFTERSFLKLRFNLIFKNSINVWLNSTILNFYVENNKFPIFDIFEIEVVNTSIEKILENSYQVLEHFKNDLWDVEFLDVGLEPNDKITMAYIKPGKENGTFKIGLASYYRLNDKLKMLAGISTPTSTELKRIKEEFPLKTGLQINMKASVRKDVYHPPARFYDKVKYIACFVTYEILL